MFVSDILRVETFDLKEKIAFGILSKQVVLRAGGLKPSSMFAELSLKKSVHFFNSGHELPNRTVQESIHRQRDSDSDKSLCPMKTPWMRMSWAYRIKLTIVRRIQLVTCR